MPAPRADDPLVPFACRVPASIATRLRAEAAETGTTVSDVLRSHLTLAEVKPLGKARPRRRENKRLASVSAADPALMQALRQIGINVDQIAFCLNSVRLQAGQFAVDASVLQIDLKMIVRELQRLAVQADPEPVRLDEVVKA